MKPHLSPPKRKASKLNQKEHPSKELISVIISILIASFISFIPIIPSDEPTKIITRIIIFSIIIITSIYVKKIVAKKLSIKITHKLWELSRWGIYKRSYLKKPIPLGLFIPFGLGLFSLGYIKPFLFFQFEAENITKRRRLRETGQRRAEKKEAYYINEEDLGYTAASGFYSLLIIALIGVIILLIFDLKFGADLTKLSIYYGAWNLLPIGKLDGSRLFFGTFYGWIFITFLYILSLALTLIL